MAVPTEELATEIATEVTGHTPMAIAAFAVFVARQIANPGTFMVRWVTLIAVALYPSAGMAQAAPPPASAFCKPETPFRYSSAPPSWTGWSTSATNTRFYTHLRTGNQHMAAR